MTGDYLTMLDLHDPGWNDRLVRHYLGDADDLYLPPGPDPGRPRRLYRLSRVEQVENNRPEFAEKMRRRAELASRTRQPRAARTRRLHIEVNLVELPRFDESYEDLVRSARERRAVLVSLIPDERLALDLLLDSLKPLLENALALSTWHPGIREARLILKQRALDHVVKHYPALTAVSGMELAVSKGGAEPT